MNNTTTEANEARTLIRTAKQAAASANIAPDLEAHMRNLGFAPGTKISPEALELCLKAYTWGHMDGQQSAKTQTL